MNTTKPIQIALWNLACGSAALAAACGQPGSAQSSTSEHATTTDEKADTEAAFETDGQFPSETDPCDTEDCDAADTSSGEDTGETGDEWGDRCDYNSDCSVGLLCEVYDDGYTSMPYADCLGYDLYRIPTCDETPPLLSIPLPSLDHEIVSLSFVDVDSDGRDDLIAGHDEGASVLYGPGAGQFEPLPVPQETVVSSATGDFDGDGFGDIATLAEGGRLTVLAGADGHMWTPARGLDSTGADEVLSLDFDGGATDLVLFDRDEGQLEIWRSNEETFVLETTLDQITEPMTLGHATNGPFGAVFLLQDGRQMEVSLDGAAQVGGWQINRSFGPAVASVQLNLGPGREAQQVLTNQPDDWTIFEARGWRKTGPYDDDSYRYLPFPIKGLQAADLDGGGREELLVETDSGFAIVYPNLEGTELGCYVSLNAAVHGVWATGDLDGDGRDTFVSFDGADALHQSLPPSGALAPTDGD